VLAALDEGATPEEQPPAALVERLAFHIDLGPVALREAQPIAATADDIAEARRALAQVQPLAEPAVEALCAAAEALGVDSLRAPWLTLRAARALAALEGREAVDRDDLSTAARLVLTPRATRAPAPAAPSSEPTEPDREAASDAPASGDEHQAEGSDTPEQTPSLTDIVLEAAVAALPSELARLWAMDRPPDRTSRFGRRLRRAPVEPPPRPADRRPRRQHPAAPPRSTSSRPSRPPRPGVGCAAARRTRPCLSAATTSACAATSSGRRAP
jgi:magnesium chelatase subunit D